MKADVTVAISVYNAEKYIHACIESLLAQTVKNFEIIIVEDPPFGGVKNIIDTFEDKRIRYERNQKYLGLSRSRNKCVELAKGNYIFFTDADCVVSKNWIEQGLKSFREQDCIGVEGKTYYVSEEYHPTYSDRVIENKKGGQFMTCNMAYKKSIVEHLGGFDERYIGSEDRDLALRAMRLGRIHFNPEMIVYHQKMTRKPVQYIHMGKSIGKPHPRVLLYKKFGDRPFFLWRIVNPLNLAIILFPPLILVSLFFNSFKTMEDFNLLPFTYLYAVFDRLQLWKTCARERVFLI